LTPWKPPANLGTLALRSKPPGSRRKEGLSSPVPGRQDEGVAYPRKGDPIAGPDNLHRDQPCRTQEGGHRVQPDGHYIYIGNFTTRDISILRVDGTDVVDTGKRMKLPAQPASMRGGAW